MSLEFIDYDVDPDKLEEVEVMDLVVYSTEIMKGTRDYTYPHHAWIAWKSHNNINEIQGMLLFEKVFLPRILLASAVWYSRYRVLIPRAI